MPSVLESCLAVLGQDALCLASPNSSLDALQIAVDQRKKALVMLSGKLTQPASHPASDPIRVAAYLQKILENTTLLYDLATKQRDQLLLESKKAEQELRQLKALLEGGIEEGLFNGPSSRLIDRLG